MIRLAVQAQLFTGPRRQISDCTDALTTCRRLSYVCKIAGEALISIARGFAFWTFGAWDRKPFSGRPKENVQIGNLMISRYCIATVVLLVTFDACAEGRSRDEPAAGADGAGIDKPLAERITALKHEFEARVKTVSSELAAARKAGAKGGSKEIKAVIGNFQRDWEKTAEKVVTLVRAHPTDPATFEGILLLRGGFDDDILELVRQHFLNDPRMGRLCADLQWRVIDSSMDLLRDIAAKSPNRQIRGQATYSLGQYAQGLRKELIANHRLSDSDQEQLMSPIARKFYKKMIADRRLTDSEEEKLLGEAQGYFDKVLKEYPDVTSADGSFRLADKARTELAWIANVPGLKVGKMAPGINGEDLDGKPLKLKDYRGKVVVLCFWATWCSPCMAMVPRERELVNRMEGKPFALVGVNADETDKREKARKATRDERMNWPSFWDGGTSGPTHMKYNIDHHPTVYVLDAKGVIRYIDAEGKDLDRAVDALVRESESGSKRDADG
jgi:peroxiredoxin